MLPSDSFTIPIPYREKGTRLWRERLDYDPNNEPAVVRWGNRKIAIEQFTEGFRSRHNLMIPVELPVARILEDSNAKS